MSALERPLASGRDADIFEHAPGLVLRRSRAGRSLEHEARVMEYVRTSGYPVPAVHEVRAGGTELVMERIEGVSMVDALSRKPWTVRRQGAVLADLHRRLHAIPAPDFLPAAPVGTGCRIVHMDLHPLNVMMCTRGPVVIDWTSAARGDPAVDVAIAHLLMACGDIPAGRAVRGLLVAGRALMVGAFAGAFDRNEVDLRMRAVVEWKVQDPHMSPGEVQAMWHEAARSEARVAANPVDSRSG